MLKQVPLLIKTHSKGGAYWKEGTKSNQYGSHIVLKYAEEQYKVNPKMVYGFRTGKQQEDRENDPGCGRERVRKRKAIVFLGHDTINVLLPLTSLKGIAPITVVTYRDKLKYEEECKDALDNAATATGSSLRHTFFMRNYTEDNRDRNPETEKTVFDILNCALMNAERAVKIMKKKEKDKQEGEMMKALEGVIVSGQVAPDSADGNFSVCVFSLIIIENNGLCTPTSYFI